MNIQKIGIIGLGNLGTALGHWFAHSHPVLAWTRSEDVVQEICHSHTNSRYLENFQLHPNLSATTNLDAVIKESNCLFWCLPSSAAPQFIHNSDNHIPNNTLIINTSKGMDRDTGDPLYHCFKKQYPNNSIFQLSGPMIANEFSRGTKTSAILSGTTLQPTELDDVFTKTPIQVHFVDDIQGVVWGGVLKNIYALGYGILESLGQNNTNHKGMYIVKALKEMVAIAQLQGGKTETLLGIAGLGDFIATALSEYSHNHQFGQSFIHTSDITADTKKPEGYWSLKAIEKHSIVKNDSFPLITSLTQYINQKISTSEWLNTIIQLVN